MTDLTTLTNEYNAIADAAMMPWRDKRFHSRTKAIEAIAEAKGKAIILAEVRRKRAINERNDLIAGGFGADAVDRMTADEKRMARNIIYLAESAASDTRKFANEVAKDPAYAVKWGENAVKSAVKGTFAKRIVMGVNGDSKPSLGEVIKHEVDEMTHSLLRDNLNGGSTSAYSNAVEGTMRTAYSQLVERFRKGGW